MDPAIFDTILEEIGHNDPAWPMIVTLKQCLQTKPTISTDTAAEELMDNITALDKRLRAKNQEWILAETIADIAPDVPQQSTASQRLLDIAVALYTSDRWPVSCDFPDRFDEALCETWKDVDNRLEPDEWALAQGATVDGAVTRFRNFLDFELRWDSLANSRRKTYKHGVIVLFMQTLEGDPDELYGQYLKPCDGLLFAMAEAMLLDGQKMYEAICDRNLDMLNYPGGLWGKICRRLRDEELREVELPKHRWMFWKTRLQMYSTGELDTDEHRFSEEAKAAAATALKFMEGLEDS